MSARYELGRLLLRLAAAVAAALVLALLWALAHGGDFRHSLELGCYVIGGLALLMGAVGGSPSRRDAASASWIGKAARWDTFQANAADMPGTTVTPAILALVVAVLMTLLGWAIS